MKKQTDTFKRLRVVIKDVNGDNRQIIKTMQDQIDYLMEFIGIHGEILEEKTGHRQPELSDDWKKRLAHRGKKLNQFLLGQVAQCMVLKGGISCFLWISVPEKSAAEVLRMILTATGQRKLQGIRVICGTVSCWASAI